MSRRDEEEIDRIIRERRTDDRGRRDRGEAEDVDEGDDDALLGMKTGAAMGEWRVPLTRDLVNRGFIAYVRYRDIDRGRDRWQR